MYDQGRSIELETAIAQFEIPGEVTVMLRALYRLDTVWRSVEEWRLLAEDAETAWRRANERRRLAEPKGSPKVPAAAFESPPRSRAQSPSPPSKPGG